MECRSITQKGDVDIRERERERERETLRENNGQIMQKQCCVGNTKRNSLKNHN